MTDSYPPDEFGEWERDTLPGDKLPPASRVLVVDDDNEMRRMIRERLTREGFDVTEARSGEGMLDTLERLEAESWPAGGVELLIVDLRMAGIDGLEALRRLRAESGDVPALLMTAFPDSEVRRRARELGVPVLAKPFALEDLCRAVGNLLASSELGLELTAAER